MRGYYIFVIILFSVGIIFKVNNIKDVKLLKISIITLIGVTYFLSIFMDLFILPLPTYYIKAKEEFQIERIIEKEMNNSDIKFDMGTINIINCFLGKYNQLYLCRYEYDGVEEVRMFDFKQNIFGNLKPAHDFGKSKVILRGETDIRHNFRRIQEGLGTYYVYYGYGTGPFLEDGEVGNFKIRNVNPEGFYLLVERYDHTPPIIWRFIVLISFLIIIFWKSKREKLRENYKVVKVAGKKINLLEIEYYK